MIVECKGCGNKQDIRCGTCLYCIDEQCFYDPSGPNPAYGKVNTKRNFCSKWTSKKIEKCVNCPPKVSLEKNDY